MARLRFRGGPGFFYVRCKIATKKELEFILRSIADNKGLNQLNAELVKTIFNARQLSQKQYDVVVRMVQEGKNLNQISAELRQLATEERALARAADEAEKAQKGLSDRLKTIQSALAAYGVAVSVQQLTQFVNASREMGRAETDAVGALKTSARGIADYQDALQLAREATKGMASDQELAASESVLFGAGLATNAQQAADLASAGTVLSQVFASAGASQELFVRLLSSGSIALYNNFGLTAQMVNAKQKEIEATTNLTGAEAKSQALKEILIAQSQKYQNSLSQESIAAAQAQAAQSNFMASFGNLVNALDSATGATDFYTASLNKLTEGAKAWQVVLQQQIPAIQQHEAAMAAQAAQTILTAQGYDELEAATDAAAQNQQAFQDALLANVDSHAEYQAAVDKVAQSNIFLAGELDLTAAEFDALKAAMAGAAQVAAGNAYASMRNLTIATSEAAAAARDLATAEAEVGQQQQANAALRAAKEAAPELGARVTEARAAAFQERTAREQALAQANEREARQAAQAARQTGQAIVKAMEPLAGEISSAVSSAISGVNQDVIGDLLGVENVEQNAGEAVRRMAAVAAGGIQNEWASQLATQLTGVQDQTAQAFVNAFQAGDEGKLKAAAQQLALNPIVDMFDANLIAQQVEAKLRAQQLQQQLNDKVNALLGEKGLQAVTTATQQVQQVATETGAATTQVGESVSGLAVTSETAGKQISEAFKGAIPAIDTLIERFRLMLGQLTEINMKAGQAAGNIAGMNPPAAGLPSTADKKMGGPSPL